MFYIKVKALGLDYFNKVCKHFDSENISYKLTYDYFLRGSYHSLLATRENNGEKKDFWACYGKNENRLAITQLADAYFPTNEHEFACNLVFPHTMINYNIFKKGYIESFEKYLTNYGINKSLEKTPLEFLENIGTKNIFSTLIVPIDSPLHYGKYKDIFQKNKIYGMVCYGTNLNTTAYSGYGYTQEQNPRSIYYLYGSDKDAPIVEALAKIYFDNIFSIKLNNLPKNTFSIIYTSIIDGYIYGLDELLIRSGVKLITQK